jgi:hypothetical protein
MLTGVPPFRGVNAFATMLAHQVNDPPTLEDASEEANERREFPEWLEGLVASMLAKNPDERVQTLQEVLDVISYHVNAERRRAGGQTTLRSRETSTSSTVRDATGGGKFENADGEDFKKSGKKKIIAHCLWRGLLLHSAKKSRGRARAACDRARCCKRPGQSGYV